MRLRWIPLVLVSVAVVACSSADSPSPLQHHQTGDTPPAPADDTTPGTSDTKPPANPGKPPPGGTTVTSETWSDGKTITGNVTIAAGATVTIAPGATVTVSPDVAITVAGTLKATTSATHAKLTSGAAPWAGLVIASGGTLTADSLDVTNAKIALWTQAGNADATYANGAIDAAQPFQMEAGSKLSISKSSAKATAASALAGTFTASYLTYDKGTAEGLYASDPAATLTFSDCTLKGNGGGDYIVSSNAKLLKVEYTTVSGSHCPFHFDPPGPAQYTVDHISDDTNGYGWMLYASGAGPNTISNSNFADSLYDIEMKGTNGAVSLTNNFFVQGTNPNKLQSVAKIVSTAPSRIQNAKPR